MRCKEAKPESSAIITFHLLTLMLNRGIKVQKANPCIYSSYNREETKARAEIATQGVAKESLWGGRKEGDSREGEESYFAGPTENVEVRAGIPGGIHTWKVWGERQEEMLPSFFPCREGETTSTQLQKWLTPSLGKGTNFANLIFIALQKDHGRYNVCSQGQVGGEKSTNRFHAIFLPFSLSLPQTKVAILNPAYSEICKRQQFFFESDNFPPQKVKGKIGTAIREQEVAIKYSFLLRHFQVLFFVLHKIKERVHFSCIKELN